ncbi:(d)CMP kinase [Alkalibacter mobilis]|uniref:(d)CMP kinase n=1 Tax=Alkalibacter mobilis TaxID=2787712 RepID=UPI00189F5BD3|nr:(d)CMP kinase [Alkalibacter mobilis]MBF7097628.1 (d)CMP kinase [Alkalibacter mobilis]
MKIAIDGPAGAGKSTIAKILAEKLKINYLDTGAMYRAATLKVIQDNIDPKSHDKVLNSVENAAIEFKDNKIYLDGVNVQSEIRSQMVTNLVSVISKIPEVRELMVRKQKKISQLTDVVMDGRDIGTVVMPDADFKFYLDASIEIRALRRFKELDEKGDLEALKQDIEKRDKEDKTRKSGPLRIAEDAIVIDTSHMSIDQVVEQLISKIEGD